MKILILGGTQFVGRHIAEAHLTAGHVVAVFNRGVTPDALPEHVERLRGDRDAGPRGLDALGERTWDACIDVSGFTPRQVRPAAELLRTRVGRYVFISAVAVYGDPPAGPVTEESPRVRPAPDDVVELDQEMYGRAKVACEDLVTGVFEQRATVLRPQIVAGPYDPFDRYSYWIRRVMQPGPLLAPGDGSDHVQVVDARDLARFTVRAVEDQLHDVYNISGHRLTWRSFLTDVLGAREEGVAWVPADVLRKAGVTEQQLPLFRATGGPRSALMDVDHSRAVAAGFTLTDPRETARATREWLRSESREPALPQSRERELRRLAAGRRTS